MNDYSVRRLTIFPDRAGQRAGWIRLNDCAHRAHHQPKVSQFLNPRLTDRFLAAVHRKMHWDYSLTPYLEDRAHVWRGSYLDEKVTKDRMAATHLAIDVNVPAKTSVSLAHTAHVVDVIEDRDQNNGWGTVIVFALDKPLGEISHFIYAHLAAHTIAVQPGQIVRPGTVVGHVGQAFENGGWYEHLHVQAFTAAKWAVFAGDLTKIDGYGAPPFEDRHPDFPNPLPLLGPVF